MRIYKYPFGELGPNQYWVTGGTTKTRIREILSFAKQCPDWEFIVPYRVGMTVNKGKHQVEDIAKLFALLYKPRNNMVYEESFAALMQAYSSDLQTTAMTRWEHITSNEYIRNCLERILTPNCPVKESRKNVAKFIIQLREELLHGDQGYGCADTTCKICYPPKDKNPITCPTK